MLFYMLCTELASHVLEDKQQFVKVADQNLQSITMCQINGRALYKPGYLNVTVVSSTSCARSCRNDGWCLSANYNISSNVCTLMKELDLDSPAELKYNNEFLYFTSRVC